MRDASLDEEFARLRVASPDRRQSERNAATARLRSCPRRGSRYGAQRLHASDALESQTPTFEPTGGQQERADAGVGLATPTLVTSRRTRDPRGMPPALLSARAKEPANAYLLHSGPRRPPGGSAGHSGCGDYRVRAACCGDSRRSLVRDVRGMRRSRRSFAPSQATKEADLQDFYGSDGTRTRDLRRDRPTIVEGELGFLTPSLQGGGQVLAPARQRMRLICRELSPTGEALCRRRVGQKTS